MNIESQMPGAWICDTCGFTLQKNILHTQDGSISANVSDHCEGCPNDGNAMRPLTWRKANEDLYKRAVELMEENGALKAKLSMRTEELMKCRNMVSQFLVPWRHRIPESWLSSFEESGCVIFDAIGFVRPKPVEDKGSGLAAEYE